MSGPVHHRSVFSSHIETVGYDPASAELHLTYKNGRTSIYSGVPPETAQRVTGAVSIGTAVHENLRGKHEHRYG